MKEILKNRSVWFYGLLIIGVMFVLSQYEQIPPGEFIMIIVLFGLFFPFLAYFFTRNSTPIQLKVIAAKNEVNLIFAYLLFLAVYLTVGPAQINDLIGISGEPRLSELSTMAQKLVMFVILPLVILRSKFGYGWRDFGINFSLSEWRNKKHLGALIAISLVFVAFQYFVGSGAQPIRDGVYSGTQLASGLPIVFLWLVVGVGLVEEFFFRGLLLPRIAKYFNSEVTGVVLSSLAFGLAHAPGLYLRGAGANSMVGESPSLLLSIGYSIVVLGLAGLFLGIVYSRTRNLSVVILIHALGDLLPNFQKIYEKWF